MMMKQFITSAFLSSLLFSHVYGQAETQTVTVGANGLVFSPDTITADEGDVIEFVITPGHSVTQSAFDNPCQAISDTGIYSGFPNNKATFSVTVNSSDTLWIYCSSPGHCQAGMAMVINPPTSGNTLDAYKSAAKNAGSSNSPPNVQGGVFGTPSQSSSSSSAATSASSASSGSSPTGTASSTPSSTPASSGPYSTNAGGTLIVDALLLFGVLAGGFALMS